MTRECWNCGNAADEEATVRIAGYGLAHLCDKCWPQRVSLSGETEGPAVVKADTPRDE